MARRQPPAPLEPIAPERMLVPSEIAGFTLTSLFHDRHPLYASTCTSVVGTFAKTIDGHERKSTFVIFDGVGEPEAYRGFDVARAARLAGPAFERSNLTIQGEPALRLLSRNPLIVQIHVLVADRILIQTDAVDIEPEVVAEFLEAFPIAELRRLVPQS